ncbi:hypothetical protein BV96_00446 [Sphingomonas paucimobilis]|nr:hypothetical protein BV96_00446 [Sphingomonas paucimobilis]
MQPETSGDLREELRDDAQKLSTTAAERVHSEVDARKSPVVEQARSVSSALDSAARELSGGQTLGWLNSLFEQGAQQIRQLADTLEQKDSRQLMDDVRSIARNNPGTFLAAFAAAGFAASRVLRAGPETGSGSLQPGAQPGGSPPAPAYGDPQTAGIGGAP